MPPGIESVREKVRTLDVSHNKMCSLPENIGSFLNLRGFSCSYNRLGGCGLRLIVRGGGREGGIYISDRK